MPRKARFLSVADEHAAAGGVAAVDRALTLMAAFNAQRPTLSLTELAGHAKLYKSTTLRLLNSLEHARWVLRSSDGRYQPGPALETLQQAYHAATPRLRLVHHALSELVAATGESAVFYELRGAGPTLRRVVVDRVESPHNVQHRLHPGDLMPLDRGTGGRVMTAYVPALLSMALREQPSDGALYDQIRSDGYYAAVGDNAPEIAGISVPVITQEAKGLSGVISITSPAARHRIEHVAHVLEAGRRLAAELDMGLIPRRGERRGLSRERSEG
jgi:DNA-binding IclR family transcriptional regulator